MTATVVSSSSQTATISTEHTLDTLATAGVYVLVVDVAALVGGDVVELRVYGKARTGDTERLLHVGTYAHQQASPLVMSVPVVSPHHFKATLKQVAGTGRSFPWAIYST